MKKQVLEQLDTLPPCLCRLVARVRGGRAKTLAEIKMDSGLSKRKVTWIARQPTWLNVKVGDMISFAEACGADLLRPRKKLFYLKRAYAQSGLKALSRGLSPAYVSRQILILEEHNERMRMGSEKPTGRYGRQRKKRATTKLAKAKS